MNIVFLGPPGSGKGTIAKKLAQDHGFVQVSTGDIIREEIKKATPLGKKAKSIVEAGTLLSDEVINELMRQYADDNTIFDGYPRSIGQAQALESFTNIDSIIYFEVSEDIIVDRLTGRRTCPKDGSIYHIKNFPPKKPGICDKCGASLIQRKDDQPQAVKERFREYQKKTKPLIEFYKNKNLLKTIDASGTPDTIYQQVKQVLNLK